MAKLFIYYSFTGNGDTIATYLSEKGYELRKVEEKKKMPKTFFFSILQGGFRAGINAKGKLINYDNDVSKYEEIVIGSPIWNGKLVPAINSVLEQTSLSDKKVSFVLYSGSGNGKKAEKKINKLFSNSKIIILKEPSKNKTEINKLQEL